MMARDSVHRLHLEKNSERALDDWQCQPRRLIHGLGLAIVKLIAASFSEAISHRKAGLVSWCAVRVFNYSQTGLSDVFFNSLDCERGHVFIEAPAQEEAADERAYSLKGTNERTARTARTAQRARTAGTRGPEKSRSGVAGNHLWNMAQSSEHVTGSALRRSSDSRLPPQLRAGARLGTSISVQIGKADAI